MGENASGIMKVVNITLYVKTAVGKRPVDMSTNTLVISYIDPYKAVDRLTRGSEVDVEEIQGDGDTLLEYGEVWKVVIHVDQIYNGTANVKLRPNDVVTIEIKPSTGSILKVERMLPPAIDYVMDLA